METISATNCPNCDGFGFKLVLKTPWEESDDSPKECENCGGMGLIIYVG